MPYYTYMIINDYIGWPTNVNKIILENSTISIGEGALKNDTMESGMKRGYQRNSYVPDKYNITMEFDWVKLDHYGNNEYQRFIKWFKYTHKYGQVPFQFPQILYSPETGITIVDAASQNYKAEYYRITSAAPGKKVGEKMQISMTWETVFYGTVQVETMPEAIRDSVAHKNYCEVTFSVAGDTEPVSDYFKMYVRKADESLMVPMDIVGFNYSDNVARIYYPPLAKGSYVVNFDYISPSLSSLQEYPAYVSI